MGKEVDVEGGQVLDRGVPQANARRVRPPRRRVGRGAGLQDLGSGGVAVPIWGLTESDT